MDENIGNNKIIEEDEIVEQYEFKHNFINTPWDDRSRNSKISVITLLLTIFLVTMACVINNLVMLYQGYSTSKNHNHTLKQCHIVKFDNYKYTAVIVSVTTKEVLCVGAVVSNNSILASEVCVRSGAIRLRLGSPADPFCRKGVSAGIIEPIKQPNNKNKLALISTIEDISSCVKIINIGSRIDANSWAYIIGRPLQSGKYLSRQPILLENSTRCVDGECIPVTCAKNIIRCPVQAGDLLVQDGNIFGFAITNFFQKDRSKATACFIDLNGVRTELTKIDARIV